MRFHFSRRAETDIENIGDYIARDNPARARSFITELRERCGALIAHPQSCPTHPELGEGVRMAVFERYLIFYIVHEDVLEIRRVLHHARDIKKVIRTQ